MSQEREVARFRLPMGVTGMNLAVEYLELAYEPGLVMVQEDDWMVVLRPEAPVETDPPRRALTAIQLLEEVAEADVYGEDKPGDVEVLVPQVTWQDIKKWSESQ